MLDKIVSTYRKAKMSVISDLSGTVGDVLDETSFYDLGYMQSQIKRIQNEVARISKELEINVELDEKSEYAVNKRQELIGQREVLLMHMIYLASNSFKNLEDCKKMAKGYRFSFMECVDGLQEYNAGNKNNAFDILENYFNNYGRVKKHFLINKVFGLLLLDRNEYQKATPYLTCALQFVPDDIETLKALKICYEKLDIGYRVAILDEILSVLA
jgi:tetratricopeptide (TPR) repeat protein